MTIVGRLSKPLNYVLEGGNNFNDELMIALCEKDNKKNEKVCLISNQPISPNAIKLKYNHIFNYRPLFMEMLKQEITDIQHLPVYQN